MILTSHRLPFGFQYTPGVLSTGLPAILRVRFLATSMASAVESAVTAFEALAKLGAFCGADIDPATSTLSMALQVSSSPGNLTWTFTGARLSDEALIPLAHLLLGAHPRASIEVAEVVNYLTPPVTLGLDADNSTYPDLYRALPFQLDDDDLQGEDYAFEIELDEPLQTEGETWLNHFFATWSRVVAMGAYAEAPTTPADAYLEPDVSIVAWDNQVEWALFKLRADGASIDALLNGLAAFHGRCQGIRRVVIL